MTNKLGYKAASERKKAQKNKNNFAVRYRLKYPSNLSINTIHYNF